MACPTTNAGGCEYCSDVVGMGVPPSESPPPPPHAESTRNAQSNMSTLPQRSILLGAGSSFLLGVSVSAMP